MLLARIGTYSIISYTRMHTTTSSTYYLNLHPSHLMQMCFFSDTSVRDTYHVFPSGDVCPDGLNMQSPKYVT